jgi:hypothetical protein
MTEIITKNPSNGVFDLEKYRWAQDYAAQTMVKKALVTVPVRKPKNQDFIRVHPGEDFQLQTAVLELKDEGETYLVDPSLWSELSGEITPRLIVTTINTQKVVSLWALKLQGDDKRRNEWNRTALEAAEIAKKKWVRVQSNMSLGGYDVFVATANLPEPDWNDIDFQKLIETAFKDRVIDSIDHPVLKALRGNTDADK